MTSFQSQEPILALSDAFRELRKNRVMLLDQEPMPTFHCTPDKNHYRPLTFSASWTLDSRPRRIALLMDDVQEEYRSFASDILPNLIQLTNTFRDNKCPIVWSSWSRQFDDGISAAIDCWYGPEGLRSEEPENSLHVFHGEADLFLLQKIASVSNETLGGWYSKTLDMFWTFCPDGKSYLDERLKEKGVDTVVIAGLWTEECIVSTAYAALSLGYDVVVVGDGVATSTTYSDMALTLINGSCGKVLSTEEIVDYMQNIFVLDEKGDKKGGANGRKDDD